MTVRGPGRGVTPRGLLFAALIVAALLVPALYVAGQAGAPEEVTGFVLEVRTKAPLGVDSFDLLAADGRRMTFEIGRLDVSNGFDAAHLVAHKVTLQLVTVSYLRDGERLLAVRLADGPVPSGVQPSGVVPTATPSVAPAASPT